MNAGSPRATARGDLGAVVLGLRAARGAVVRVPDVVPASFVHALVDRLEQVHRHGGRITLEIAGRPSWQPDAAEAFRCWASARPDALRALEVRSIRS